MNGLFYGELIALLTTLSWTFGTFPFVEASRRLGANTLNHYRLLLAVLMLSVVLFFTSISSFQQLFLVPDYQEWLWFGLSGIVGLSIGDYFGFTMLSILGARIGSVFGTLAPGAALFFGYLMLGEKINFIGIIGITITAAGLVWLTFSKDERAKIPDLGHGAIGRGIFFGVLAAVFQGLGLVMAKKGFAHQTQIESLNPIHATWIRMVFATFVSFLFTTVLGQLKSVSKPFFENRNKGIAPMISGTIFGPVIGVTLSVYTISLIKVSVAQTIFALVPVCVLPLAYFFYREKVSIKAVAGALVAIIGVVVLIWREQVERFMF